LLWKGRPIMTAHVSQAALSDRWVYVAIERVLLIAR
jgi:hypothetical protein